jgi:sphingolipid delta-4 desaturase
MLEAAQGSDLRKDEHWYRRGEILKLHPEVAKLFGAHPWTAGVAACVVALQFALAAVAGDLPWWGILLLSYAAGAFCMHYLHVVIHECSHNLVLGRASLDKACAIFANLPGAVPSAMGFRHYHLLHHSYLGRRGLDPDVAPRWEAKLFGRGAFGKAMWVVLQPFTYSFLHPLQVKKPIAFDRWLIANVLSIAAADALVVHFLGWSALAYLALSTYFAVGPHPTGAHILQEHIIPEPRFETASYYGPVNWISVNHGLHLEHHDFPAIAGVRLSRLRKLSPEHYENRFQHRSRLMTVWQFVFDPSIGLDSRVIRNGGVTLTL